MRKSDKKTEKLIVSALTEVCENALKLYTGFQWLTHLVDYNHYPESLLIVCVFDTNQSLSERLNQDKGESIKAAIETKLNSQDIRAKGIKKRILFDTEEACDVDHNGNWTKRLESYKNVQHV